MADGAAAPPDAVLPQPAAAALRAVEEGGAAFANRLHGLIAAAPGLVLQRGLHRREADGEGAPVFADPAGLYWQPLDGAGQDAADLDGQMALLARYEPMLAAIEQALGLRFSPEAIADGIGPEVRWIALEGAGQACAFGFAPAWQDAARLAPPSADVPVAAVPLPVRLALRAALLPLGQAEGLGAGDLLRLPAGAVPAMLALPARRPIDCTFDPRDGLLARGHTPERTHMSLSTEEDGAERFKVPLTVRLPERAIPAADLAALAEGGTIRLGPLTEGLEVDLLVAGQPVASGEIVRLGEDFAVLIDAVAGRAGHAAPVSLPAPAPEVE